jgi:Domain of unknown function (DUF6794)
MTKYFQIGTLLGLSWLCACSEALPPVSPPKMLPTVNDVVTDVVPNLSLLSKLRIIYISDKRSWVTSEHLELGMYIRNRYGLWRDNEQLMLDACKRHCHPDDASWVILEAVWDAVHQ